MLRRLWRRGRALFRTNTIERGLEAEIKFHLEMEAERNISRGMNPEEARRAARRRFGGVDQVKESCRDEARNRPFESLWGDLKYGARILRRNPGFAAVAILTLGLGIGANTAIFSIIYGVLLRPLPFANGERLVVVRQEAPLVSINNLGFSVKEIEDYRGQSQTTNALIEYHAMNFILYGGAEPERIQTGIVSWNYFDVLGVKPLLGRSFNPEDEKDGAEAVLILSYEYWERSHRGDPKIVGRVFRMNNRPHLVIGVLPPVPQFPQENDVYMPTSACPTRSGAQFKANRNARMMNVVARLKDGVEVTQAQADFSTIASRLQSEYPDAYPKNRGYRAMIASLSDELTQRAKPTFLVLLGTAGMVLLIACFNVSNLILARLQRRERELALRAALGASRGRLIRQLLAESGLLTALGATLGILLAAGSLDLLVSFAARFTPRAGEVRLDGIVLLFTLGVSFVTCLAFGLAPALTQRENFITAMKEGGAPSATGNVRQWLRAGLVVAQVAVSFMLLCGAGLMIRSFEKLQSIDPGFDPERVIAFSLSANPGKYSTPDLYRNLSLRLLDQVKGEAGVISAAMASTYPLNPRGITFGPNNRNFRIEGRPLADGELPPRGDARVVSPDYFSVIRLPLARGRLFTEMDHAESERVAIINQSMANHLWKGEDPIGRRVSLDNGTTWAKIVGIVGDVHQYGLDRAASDEIYVPIRQSFGTSNLLVRTAADPTGVLQQLRRAIYAVDSELAIADVRTLEEVRRESLASPRLTTLLLGLFAALALAITAAGIAGVMALSVTQRTHEIGIRLALGATSSGLLRMIVGRGMAVVSIGLAIGIVGAIALTRTMSTLLYGIAPHDPLTFAGVAIVLFGAAATACYLPARRITEIDPMIALRSE
jgi:putative ABC transport system permease protein